MADVLRSCTKTGCRWPAAASLSYRYATRQVWLLDLASAPDPSLYDLCPHHADHLVVPKGWERVDDRTPQEVMIEPSASARAEAAARLRHPTTISARNRELVSSGAPQRNRYARLVEELPRLAAEAGMRRDDEAAWPPPRSAGEAPTTDAPQPPAPPAPAPAAAVSEVVPVPAKAAAPAVQDGRPADLPSPSTVPADAASPPAGEPGAAPKPVLPPPRPGGVRMPAMPSRDLAPMPPADALWPEAPAPEPEPPPAPLPGQLSIPVDDLIEASDGVVVSFDFAGGRRRAPRS